MSLRHSPEKRLKICNPTNKLLLSFPQALLNSRSDYSPPRKCMVSHPEPSNHYDSSVLPQILPTCQKAGKDAIPCSARTPGKKKLKGKHKHAGNPPRKQLRHELSTEKDNHQKPTHYNPPLAETCATPSNFRATSGAAPFPT